MGALDYRIPLVNPATRANLREPTVKAVDYVVAISGPIARAQEINRRASSTLYTTVSLTTLKDQEEQTTVHMLPYTKSEQERLAPEFPPQKKEQQHQNPFRRKSDDPYSYRQQYGVAYAKKGKLFFFYGQSRRPATSTLYRISAIASEALQEKVQYAFREISEAPGTAEYLPPLKKVKNLSKKPVGYKPPLSQGGRVVSLPTGTLDDRLAA